MSITNDPIPFAPLGDSTNAYWFQNGTMAYYRDGVMYIHATTIDPETRMQHHLPAVTVPCNLSPVIVAVARVFGLSDDDCVRLAYAAEQYGRS